MNKYILISLLIINNLLFAVEKNYDFKFVTSDNKILEIEKIKNGLNFKNLNNKLVVVVFFGHNCPPCIHEMPILTKLAKELKDDLEIIGLEVQGMNKKELVTYKDLKKIGYTLVSGLDNYDFIEYIQKEVSWRGNIPFTIMFNREGEAKYVKTGVIPYDKFKIMLKKIDK